MNMQKMMAQAQRMQREFQKALKELEEKEFTFSKGGAVTVKMYGSGQVISVNIEEDAFEKENETLTNVDVSFIGDSLTDMCQLSTYYPEYKTANRGIGGDTTFGLEARLKQSAYDLNPKVIVMLIGVNNITTMLQNYEDIVIKLKTNLPNTKIILCSLTPMRDGWSWNTPYALDNNIVIKYIAQRQGCTFVDLFSALKESSTNNIVAEFTTDGGHFTHAGYIVISNTLKPVINELLNK